MTTAPQPSSSIHYPSRTLDRAERAMRSAPFRLKFFATMMHQSVALKELAGHTGTRNQYTRRSLSELMAEAELLWLIQVGLLRREVDGQGLTDSFRITPLGRLLVQKWQDNPAQFTRGFGDRFYNFLNRWFRLPI
ncbi:MAG TPA: Npun_F0494 family protein [Thermosynechococcaceae cyanobacterium]